MQNYSSFSINNGTNTESYSYNLSNKFIFELLLSRIRNNTDGEIDPIDIRDSILSLWSNSIFKETKSGSKYYIGIDTDNPNDRDLKRKILLGKRANYGENVFINEISGNTQSDIYIYNTKLDSLNNDETKISILAGNNSNYFNNSPYISSKKVYGKGLSLDIINDLGNININAEGTASLNEIIFPSKYESEISDIDNKSLIFESGKLKWDYLKSNITEDIGDSNETLEIKGELSINDYPMEFSDSRMLPKPIGSLIAGETFSNYSVSEILNKIIYSYQEPFGSLEFESPYNKGYIEVGTSPDIFVKYTIIKKTLPTNITTFKNLLISTYPEITDNFNKTVTGVSKAIITPIPAIPGQQSYKITVSDSQTSITNEILLYVIYPIFYGIGYNTSPNYTGNNFLLKIVEAKSDKKLSILGEGRIYFFYPYEYGELTQILDESEVNVINDFVSIDYNYTSPNGYWSSKKYYIYESNYVKTFNDPVFYTFKF